MHFDPYFGNKSPEVSKHDIKTLLSIYPSSLGLKYSKSSSNLLKHSLILS